jgi:hypothetical protein
VYTDDAYVYHQYEISQNSGQYLFFQSGGTCYEVYADGQGNYSVDQYGC